LTQISTALNSTAKVIAKNTFSIVSEATGEIISSGNEKVTTSHGNVSKTTKDHTRMFTDGLKTLVQMDLQGNDLRVFLACVAYANFENKIEATNKRLSTLLDMRPEHISRSLNHLHLLGMIYIQETDGGHKIARIQPEICWKGAEKLRAKELKRRHAQFSNEAMESLTGRPEQ
jgi:hypothetical protein